MWGLAVSGDSQWCNQSCMPSFIVIITMIGSLLLPPLSDQSKHMCSVSELASPVCIYPNTSVIPTAVKYGSETSFDLRTGLQAVVVLSKRCMCC